MLHSQDYIDNGQIQIWLRVLKEAGPCQLGYMTRRRDEVTAGIIQYCKSCVKSVASQRSLTSGSVSCHIRSDSRLIDVSHNGVNHSECKKYCHIKIDGP